MTAADLVLLVAIGFAIGVLFEMTIASRLEARAREEGFEAGYRHAAADVNDIVLRIRTEVL